MSAAKPTVVLGATGMLGRSVMAEGKRRGFSMAGGSRHGPDFEVDLCDESGLSQVVSRYEPSIIINCAALVSLDECERNPAKAHAINGHAVGVLAGLATRLGAQLVQISTDHFYSGDGWGLHKESDPLTILNEYARSKRAGEQAALTSVDALVVRTNIVGFRGDASAPTFVEWLISSLRHHEKITLFDDYFTSSIDVEQFSTTLFDILVKSPRGILNLASRDVSNKIDFARRLAAAMGLETRNVSAGSINDMKGVRRAESLGLDISLAEQVLGRPLPGLDDVVGSLCKTYFKDR